MTQDERQKLGTVVSGSLTKGVDVRLDGEASVEDMAVGRYVTIDGQKQRFFGMITDVLLEATDQRLTASPPDTSDSFLGEVLAGTSVYGMLHITPYLTLSTTLNEPQPVKTVPGHFSRACLATEQDIELVFGKEDEKRFFIGNPLDMETKLCLDLHEFAKRSNGIFGKSGTGKTFLTRILLIGMLQKSKSVNLIFDMQNEYGWEGTYEGSSRKVKALKQLFQDQVAIFTLDEKHAALRPVKPDFVVKISHDEIEPEDISLLRQTLNLTDQAVEATYQLKRLKGKNWFSFTLESQDDKALSEETGVHEATLLNLKRGLRIIERMPFTTPHAEEDAVDSLLKTLQGGKNVVLEFGHNRDIASYILVANMLSRRIYSRYQKDTEMAMAKDSQPPAPLVITIEEAHKFLNPEVSAKTIFGTIAREMRKYNVSLLIIDQRPSGIDEEVMSQLGTKITCLLDNDRDIDSVLSGISGKSALKPVLARLASKQQALIFGHSVPMPVAFEVREFGSPESYKVFSSQGRQKKAEKKDIEELFE